MINTKILKDKKNSKKHKSNLFQNGKRKPQKNRITNSNYKHWILMLNLHKIKRKVMLKHKAQSEKKKEK